MPIRINKILVDSDAFSEPDTSIPRKCYRCKQVNYINCFKRTYCVNKHSYNYVK